MTTETIWQLERAADPVLANWIERNQDLVLSAWTRTIPAPSVSSVFVSFKHDRQVIMEWNPDLPSDERFQDVAHVNKKYPRRC